MSYEAIVCRLTNVRAHPNAQKLKLANACGFQLVIGLDRAEGDLGLLFIPGTQIDSTFLVANKLYRKDPATGAQWPGFFESNGKVRATKLRGEWSEAFWIELSALDYLSEGYRPVYPEEGATFTEFMGRPICRKYESLQQLREKAHYQKQGKTSPKYRFPHFREHFDTGQLRHNLNRIPEGALLYLTQKCHGTSGRTGYLLGDAKLNRFQRSWNKYCGWTGLKYPQQSWQHISGTRHAVMVWDSEKDVGYYSGTTFRSTIHKELAPLLSKGQTLYYEIVGYDDHARSIMPAHQLDDPELVKQYGQKMTYSYGCDPDGFCTIWQRSGWTRFRVLVYRITQTNEDGDVTELSWERVKQWCQTHNVESVPEFARTFHTTVEDLLALCRTHADGPDVLDHRHFREGVCVRVEHPDYMNTLKWKGNAFTSAEGIRSNEEALDPEDLS